MPVPARRLFAGLALLTGLLPAAFAAAGEPDTRPYVALIIDDLGYNWSLSRRVLDLPPAVTASILPNTPYARRLAGLAAGQGREIIVHLPMESTEPLPLGASAVTLSMDPAAVIATVDEALESVPGAIGLGNHMGSRATADPLLMDILVGALRRHPGMLFVDSRTTPDSVAYATARRLGLPAVRRDVFLDHVHEADEVGHQFERLLQRARQRGHALAIGHPIPSTLDLLDNLQQRLDIEGIRLVSLTEYARLRDASVTPGTLAVGADTGAQACGSC